MPTKEEIEIAVKVISDVAGNPDSGVVRELIENIKALNVQAKEVRVVESKETR